MRCVSDREAGHHSPLAPRRIQIVLALEVATSWWSADHAAGNTPAHRGDEHRKSTVGRAANPRRASQARYRYRSDERSQVYGQAKRAAVPGLENISQQSCRRHRGDGSVRRSDNLVSFAHGLLIMGHGRRQILWFGVTSHPTAEWISNQLTEACGWEQAPRYLIRDRDRAYGRPVLGGLHHKYVRI